MTSDELEYLSNQVTDDSTLSKVAEYMKMRNIKVLSIIEKDK